jgi:hypothetical protein
MPYWDADIFLMGHMTKMSLAPVNRISPRWAGRQGPELIHRKIVLVGTGGFAKGYVPGARQGQVARGGYVEQWLLSPAALGSPVIKAVWQHQDRTYAPTITVEV